LKYRFIKGIILIRPSTIIQKYPLLSFSGLEVSESSLDTDPIPKPKSFNLSPALDLPPNASVRNNAISTAVLGRVLADNIDVRLVCKCLFPCAFFVVFFVFQSNLFIYIVSTAHFQAMSTNSSLSNYLNRSFQRLERFARFVQFCLDVVDLLQEEHENNQQVLHWESRAPRYSRPRDNNDFNNSAYNDIASSFSTGLKMMQLDNKIAMCMDTEGKWVDGLLKYFPDNFDELEHLNHDEFVAWAQTNGKQSGPLRAIRSWLDKFKKQVADLESALGIPSVVNVNVATATITSNFASVTTVSARDNDEYYDTYNALTDNVTQTEDVKDTNK
jgi:hypothetical protein